MKQKLLMTLLIAASCSLPVIAISGDKDNHHKKNNNHATATTTEQTDAQKKDGEVIEWLMVLNKNEIAAAEVALKRKPDQAVADFAKLMIKEHNENLKATKDVSHDIKCKPRTSDDSTDLKKQGKDELATLKAINDKAEFQKAYMDAMVKGHTDAQSAIQTHIGEVTDAKLKSHLEMTETHVASHLEKAKEVKEKLDNQES